MPTPPTNAQGPALDAQRIGLLNDLAQQLTPIQQAWAGGYLTGLSASASIGQTAISPAAAEHVLTILYGSQTGHSREIAQELQELARAEGLATELISMKKFKQKQLKNVRFLALAVSTQGEGEPPDDAEQLLSYLGSKKAPKLDDLQFAVLGLGDSSYALYCKTGKDFDGRLAKLGGKRVLDRVDLDVDFDAGAEAWNAAVVKTFKELIPKNAAPAPSALAGAPAETAVHYSRKRPLKTQLLACQKITGRDSQKDIRHIEIDLEDTGLTYLPGDALGVWFKNDAELVRDLLELLEIDADAQVHVDDLPCSLADALTEKFELTQLHPGFVTAYAELTDNAALKALAAETEPLHDYVDVRQIIDVVREHPAKISAGDLLPLLRKLTPRLYSIASSQTEVEDEVHLTLGVVQYEAHGHYHLGGASGFLAHRLQEGEEVLIYTESNDNFRLPADPNTPVIMIGPGTGIAPFRSFIQERAATEAPGDNWLLFGNPTFTDDFLYQTEWQEFMEDGVLTRMDVAFSRDTAEKVYVQHRIAENSAEFWNWLQRGAHIYVCGDESRMAKDVHQALFDLVQHQGGLSEEETEAYLVQLRRDGRYQKDVY